MVNYKRKSRKNKQKGRGKGNKTKTESIAYIADRIKMVDSGYVPGYDTPTDNTPPIRLRDDPPTPADNRLVRTGAQKYVPPNFTKRNKRKKPNATENYEEYLLSLTKRDDFSEFNTNPELAEYRKIEIGGKRKNNRKTKKRRKKGGNKGPIKKSRGRKNNTDPSKIPE